MNSSFSVFPWIMPLIKHCAMSMLAATGSSVLILSSLVVVVCLCFVLFVEVGSSARPRPTHSQPNSGQRHQAKLNQGRRTNIDMHVIPKVMELWSISNSTPYLSESVGADWRGGTMDHSSCVNRLPHY